MWLLLAVAWIPEVAKIHFDVASEVSEHGEALARQFPDVTIRDGRATVVPPGPHLIFNPADGKLMVIIDTTGEHETLEGTGAAMLLTETKLHLYQERRKETRVFDLSRYESVIDRLNPDIVRDWCTFIRRWTSPVLFLLFVPFSFAYRLLQILFYAALATPFARIRDRRLDYGALVRVSAVAITVPVFLETARSMLNLDIPAWWLICFVVATSYIHFGLQSVADAPHELTPQQSETQT